MTRCVSTRAKLCAVWIWCAFFSCPCPANTVSFTLSQLVEYHQNSTGRTRRTRAMSINSTCRGRVFWPWCHIISSCSGMFWNCSGMFCSGMLRIECQTPALTQANSGSRVWPGRARLCLLGSICKLKVRQRISAWQTESKSNAAPCHASRKSKAFQSSKVPVLSIFASLQGL